MTLEELRKKDEKEMYLYLVQEYKKLQKDLLECTDCNYKFKPDSNPESDFMKSDLNRKSCNLLTPFEDLKRIINNFQRIYLLSDAKELHHCKIQMQDFIIENRLVEGLEDGYDSQRLQDIIVKECKTKCKAIMCCS